MDNSENLLHTVYQAALEGEQHGLYNIENRFAGMSGRPLMQKRKESGGLQWKQKKRKEQDFLC